MGEGEILCECAGKVFGGSNWSQTGQYEEADISTVSVSVSPETKCSSLTLFGNDKPAPEGNQSLKQMNSHGIQYKRAQNISNSMTLW